MNSQADHRSDEKLGGAGGVAVDATRAKPNGKRKQLLMAVFGVVVLLGSVYGAYWWIVARYTEATDNAYVGGNVVQITPQVEGTVVTIGVDDTDYVQAGQPLAQLDRTDAAVALKKAEAQLAQTIRETRGLYADTARLQAAVAERQVHADKARDDLVRREKLVKSNYVSDEDLQHSRDAARTSEAALQVAQATARRQPCADRRHLCGNPSQCRARRGGVTRSLARLSTYDLVGAGVGLRRQAQRTAGATRESRIGANGDCSAGPGLGQRQLQGKAAREYPARPAGLAARRCLWRRYRVPWDRDGSGRGHR